MAERLGAAFGGRRSSRCRRGEQVVAGGVEAVAESRFGGQGLGVGEPGAGEQPGRVAVRWWPRRAVLRSMSSAVLRSWRSSRSHPASVSHWRSRLSSATSTTTWPSRVVFDQQALGDQRIDQVVTALRQVFVARHPPGTVRAARGRLRPHARDARSWEVGLPHSTGEAVEQGRCAAAEMVEGRGQREGNAASTTCSGHRARNRCVKRAGPRASVRAGVNRRWT